MSDPTVTAMGLARNLSPARDCVDSEWSKAYLFWAFGGGLLGSFGGKNGFPSFLVAGMHICSSIIFSEWDTPDALFSMVQPWLSIKQLMKADHSFYSTKVLF